MALAPGRVGSKPGQNRNVGSAADVKTQGKGAGQEAPFDPNLECPTCGCRFKIGQIQLFRQHAASCNNKRVKKRGIS